MSGASLFINESTLAINLSYVLHERSDSRAVRRACREAKRFDRHRSSRLAAFQRYSDSKLDMATVVTPHLQRQRAADVRASMIVTVRVGFPELIPRVLSLKSTTAIDHTDPDPHVVDEPRSDHEKSYVHLFRGRASLPEIATPNPNQPVLVAALVARPGGETLQLTGSVIDPNELPDSSNLLEVPAIRSTLETLIRDYADQWCPPVRLWEQPAESGLDDLRVRPADRG